VETEREQSEKKRNTITKEKNGYERMRRRREKRKLTKKHMTRRRRVNKENSSPILSLVLVLFTNLSHKICFLPDVTGLSMLWVINKRKSQIVAIFKCRTANVST
jgi:hypothetical protein